MNSKITDSKLITDVQIEKIKSFLTNTLASGVRRTVPMDDVLKHMLKDIGSLEPYRFKQSLSYAVHEGRLSPFVMYRGKAGGLGHPKTETDASKASTSSNIQTTHTPERVLSVSPVSSVQQKHQQKLIEPQKAVSIDLDDSDEFDDSNDSNDVKSLASSPVPRSLDLQVNNNGNIVYIVDDRKYLLPQGDSVEIADSVMLRNGKTLTYKGRDYLVPANMKDFEYALKQVFLLSIDERGSIEFEGKRYSANDEAAKEIFDNFVDYCLVVVEKGATKTA